MRGAIIKRHTRSCPCRSHGMRTRCAHCRRCSCQSWAVVFDRYVAQPDGRRRRKQVWVTVRGTRAQAEARLAEAVRDSNRGVLVADVKLTLAEWLHAWLQRVEPARRPATVRAYRIAIDSHLLPALGSVRVAALTPLDVEAYLADEARRFRPATVKLHYAVLHGALDAALKAGLVSRNVAALATKPRRSGESDVRSKCLAPEDCRRLLDAARQAGPMWAAFVAVAIDSGARRGELLALRWSDVDLNAARLVIARQLIHPAREPMFGPTKTGRTRTVDLAPDTIALLAAHRREQASVVMRNRHHYRTDLDLVFARTPQDGATADTIGLPWVPTVVGRRFRALCEAAGLPKTITLHALRHTSASLALASGAAVPLVAARLGHASASTTLNIYAHAVPGSGQEVARRLGALIHG
jgi:integrase